MHLVCSQCGAANRVRAAMSSQDQARWVRSVVPVEAA